MKTEKYRHWLYKKGYPENVVSSRISNCQRIEDNLNINLDVVFANGKWRELSDLFTYSTSDWRNRVVPSHGIAIEGNWYNGTATLRSALNLYNSFLIELKYNNSDKEETTSMESQCSDQFYKKTSLCKNEHTAVDPIDSYQLFCDDFCITPEQLYNFGIKHSIFVCEDEAWEQWQNLKKSLIEGGEKIAIRSYGRGDTNPFITMYKTLFPKAHVVVDSTGNAAPKKLIQMYTQYKINKTIFNFEISHVYGLTKNPLLFSAIWNFFLCPRIIDPFTGHASSGRWPDEYQPRLRKVVTKKFAHCINDYNSIVTSPSFQANLTGYLEKLDWGNKGKKDLDRFIQDAKKEWAPITIEG